MFRVFNNKRAATLIEVVIAILILACAFFPILRVVDYGSVSTAKIGNYAKATRLAQELIEECKHVPFSLWKKFHVPENPEPNQIIDFDTINEDFYKGTKESIKAFAEEEKTKDKIKEFKCEAKAKLFLNEYKQIYEIWLEVEISWYDMGKISDAKGEKRIVKVSNSYHNPEAIYQGAKK